jgi:serine/threonine protein kinase
MLFVEGEVIDDYIVKSHIKGGMSDIYICEHSRSYDSKLKPSECVMKFPTVDISTLTDTAYKNMLSEFKTECSIAAKLSRHSSYINIFSAYQRNSYPYLKMEKADYTISTGMGVTNESVQLIYDLLSGFSWAESSLNITHGDIKPSNILIKNNRVKICDFGLSIFRDEKGGNAGTLKYCAPELLSGGNINTKTDIYSLGITIKEILFGNEYNEKPIVNIVKKIMKKTKTI